MERAARSPEASGDGKVLRDGERHVVRFVRDFPLTVAQTWSMVTEPRLVQGWLGHVEKFELFIGGAIEILLHPVNGAWLRGTVLSIEAPRLIEYSWTVPAHGVAPSFSGSWLRLEVIPLPEGARLRFSHSLEDGKRVLDILAASHLRLDQLPPRPGQRAVVERSAFLAQRAYYEKTISIQRGNTP